MKAIKVREIDALITLIKEPGELTGVKTPFTVALLGLGRLEVRVRGLC